MTPDKPTPSELLDTAAAVLRREILPDAGDKKLDVLMILNILGIAKRTLLDEDGIETRQADRFARLPGGEPNAKALADAIRNGGYDSGQASSELHRLLLEDAKDRLSISSPGYLATALAEDKES